MLRILGFATENLFKIYKSDDGADIGENHSKYSPDWGKFSLRLTLLS